VERYSGVIVASRHVRWLRMSAVGLMCVVTTCCDAFQVFLQAPWPAVVGACLCMRTCLFMEAVSVWDCRYHAMRLSFTCQSAWILMPQVVLISDKLPEVLPISSTHECKQLLWITHCIFNSALRFNRPL
jgi:hypothetical protein